MNVQTRDALSVLAEALRELVAHAPLPVRARTEIQLRQFEEIIKGPMQAAANQELPVAAMDHGLTGRSIE